MRGLSVYELNHLVFSYTGFYHRCYSLLLSGFRPVIFRSLARDSTFGSLPCDSIGLGLSSQAEQIGLVSCVCVCILRCPFRFHPDSPRVLHVLRPPVQIRENRVTTEAIGQLVASSLLL